MSQSTHTPGPWLARTYPNSKGEISAIKIWAQDEFKGEIVCAMSPETPGSVQSTHEAYANAHLIASAPELLEALKVVYIQLRPDGWKGEQTRLYDGCLHPTDDDKTVVDLLETAIAKAEGRA